MDDPPGVGSGEAVEQGQHHVEKGLERQARVVELRFFAGLSMSEVAEVLGVSKRTADGDWARARAWLERELAGAAGAHP